jgi:hypothetical protein
VGLFRPNAGQASRAALDVDDDTGVRAEGWVRSGGFGIPCGRTINPVLLADMIRAIEAVLADPDPQRRCRIVGRRM